MFGFVCRRVGVIAVCLLSSVALAARPAPGAAADYADKEAAWARHQELREASLFDGLAWRAVGPVVQGGRVVDIATVPGEPYTFYDAYASGGVWKTTNNGVTFEPLWDEMPTMIVGDIAVDPSKPATVWAGSGENTSSRSSYGGMGMYRSDDAGATWRHMGLGETDRIGRVLVDPNDSNTVWVAAIGKLYTTGGDRRFVDRMPASEAVISEMMADVVYLDRNRRRQEMKLEKLDVVSVEQIGPESLELRTREYWRLRFVGLDGKPLANAPRREWVHGRYRVTRAANTWRVMAWDLDNLDERDGAEQR